MITKKIPMRMCVVCKNNFPKKELLRIVKNDVGFELDKTGKASGRGCYICNSQECKEKFFKQKYLNKILKSNVNESCYNALKEQLFE